MDTEEPKQSSQTISANTDDRTYRNKSKEESNYSKDESSIQEWIKEYPRRTG